MVRLFQRWQRTPQRLASYKTPNYRDQYSTYSASSYHYQRWCTYDDIKAESSLSHGNIQRIIHEHLKLKKDTSRFVSHILTEKNCHDRVRICQENLARFEEGMMFWLMMRCRFISYRMATNSQIRVGWLKANVRKQRLDRAVNTQSHVQTVFQDYLLFAFVIFRKSQDHQPWYV